MKYLVFALQGLGDTLEATPVVAGLKAWDPSAEVHVAVTRGGSAQIFRAMPELVANVIELPYWERGATAFASALLAHARRSRYAASFMTYPAAKAAYHFVNLCFRAQRKFGHRYFEPNPANLLWSYTDLVPIRAVTNVERNLDLLAAANIPLPSPVEYVVPASWLGDVARDPRLITIHVGTIAHDGLENRRWPLQNFASVARHLQLRGYEITLLAGPSEYEETRSLLAEVPGARIVQGPLNGAAAHLARSAVVITNDSGIGHLAAAVKTPVVTLFGPTPTTHAPFGSISYPLRPSSCPPCFDPRDARLYCKLDIDYRCLKRDLTVDLVIEQLHVVLERHMIDA